MASSDHFDGQHFFNPHGGAAKGFAAVLRWQWQGGRKAWPRWVTDPAYPPPPAPGAGQAVVTFINHSTFLIQTEQGTLLTDPIFAERASPVPFAGPKRVRKPGLPLAALPHIDVVLVSHNHYDHLDIGTLQRLGSQHRPLFITGLGNAALLKSKGLQDVVELDWWEEQTARDLRIRMTPAQHFSARGLRDRNRTLWASFVIEAGERRIFFAADSGYAPHFREVRQRCGPFDLAFLPIGAYEPRWFMQDVHMNPADAVRAHLDLGGPPSVAMHFGTFRLSNEGIDDPARDLRQSQRERGLDENCFWVPGFGESRTFPDL